MSSWHMTQRERFVPTSDSDVSSWHMTQRERFVSTSDSDVFLAYDTAGKVCFYK